MAGVTRGDRPLICFDRAILAFLFRRGFVTLNGGDLAVQIQAWHFLATTICSLFALWGAVFIGMALRYQWKALWPVPLVLVAWIAAQLQLDYVIVQ